MSSSGQKPRTCDAYRFDQYEVRVHSDMLMRDEERVRIQELPFRLLLVLLENHGQVVSNEELGRRLGGEGWFVELGSLRVAVTKLREALGDNASAPRFIRTVSGQGYKFIAPVTPVFDPVPSADSAQVAESVTAEGRVAPKAARLRVGRWGVWALAGVVLAVALAALWFWRMSVHPVASERDTVVVGGFTNHTDDHALDGTLSSAFLVKMQESPYLNLLMDRRFRELIQNPEEATLTDELNACRSLHGQVLLGGDLVGAGSDRRVELMAWRCSNGHLLTRQVADARSEAEVLPALNRAAEQMRRRLGEPDSSLQRFNVPLAQATTSSLAALRAFTQGEEKRLQGHEEESIRDFRFAIDLDPQFALAYARLGTIYYNSGEYALSKENYQKAFDLRGRTTDRERLYITANYYMCNMGDAERAIEAYDFWRRIYPRDIAPVNNLAIQYLLIGQPEKAVGLARVGMAMDTDAGSNIMYGTWTWAFLQTGDYKTLNQLCDGPLRQNAAVVAHVNCFQGAFAQGNEAGMRRELDWSKGQPEEGLLMEEAAIVALYRGRAAEGWRLFQAAADNAAENSLPEAALGARLNMAGYQADLGERQKAHALTEQGMTGAEDSVLLSGFAAVALARSGDVAQAEAMVARLAQAAPQNTLLNQSILASARAAIALERHEPEAAIAALEPSRPYDFNDYMFLAPAYYRGVAYLAAKKPKEAVAEFDRLAAHRALFPSSPYLVLGELERARALQIEGDVKGARAGFARLDAIWKNADADFAPLRELRGYEQALPR